MCARHYRSQTDGTTHPAMRASREIFAPRNVQRIKRLIIGHCGQAHPFQFCVQKFHIKRGIVDDQFGIT